MKATKIRGEISQHLVCALHAPRHCMSLAQCDLMQKDSRRKKKRTDKDVRRWHTHGSQKLEYSWIHGARRLSQYKKSVPRDTSRRFHRALERSAPSCKEKQNKYIYIYWPGSSSPVISRLSHPSLVFFVLSLHDCAGEAVVSHLQLRPSHLRSAPLFRMFSVM